MSIDPPEEQLLLPFELQVMHGDFKEYFKTKRQCWLGSIQMFPDLWNLFITLDAIFHHEIDDLKVRPNTEKVFAQLLFIKAHQGIRVAAEIAFSTHISQAYDLTRSAIDVAVIAHKIYREPNFLEIFLKRDDGKIQLEKFNDAFLRNKRANLFPEKYSFLVELHGIYSRFSDWGTHPSIYSVAHHYRVTKAEGVVNFGITYTEADPQKIASVLYDVISAFAFIEKAFHDAFSSRLTLDPELHQMRMQTEADRKRIAAALIKQFNIKGPEIIISTN